MMRLEWGPTAVLGKLPTFPEYLRVGVSDPLVASFDDWLTRSMDKLMARPAGQWRARYAEGMVHGFVFRTRAERAAGRVLVGAIRPSADVAGRTFPLAIAAPVTCSSEFVRSPELLPMLLDPFWLEASELLLQSPQLTKPDLEAGARRLRAPDDAEASSVAASYRTWLGELPVNELWALLDDPAGSGPSPTAERMFRMLLECIRPVRGAEQPATPLTLRLSLGQAGGAAVCFWLDLVRRMAGWKSTLPSYFWAHDGSSGTMLLHVGEPPIGTLSELWAPTGGQDEFCDLTAPVPESHAQWLPALPPRLAQACAGDRDSVLALLDLVGK